MKKFKLSKSSLAIALSELEVFKDPKVMLEQYPTPSELASDLVWQMYMRKEAEGKIILDLGAGTGILGIGAMLVGAKKVFFVDIDKKALEIAEKNIQFVKEKYNIECDTIIVNMPVKDLSKESRMNPDTVIQNPPFGIKKRHADRIFLEKAMELTKNIYSFHYSESEGFINKLCRDKGFFVNDLVHYEYMLPKSMDFHKNKIKRIKAGLWNLKKR